MCVCECVSVCKGCFAPKTSVFKYGRVHVKIRVIYNL